MIYGDIRRGYRVRVHNRKALRDIDLLRDSLWEVTTKNQSVLINANIVYMTDMVEGRSK